MQEEQNYIDKIFDMDLPVEVRREIIKQIQYITSNFDFIKVHKYMDFVNWSWFDTDGVPSVFDLHNKVCDLLLDTAVKSYYNDTIRNVATGGFYVEVDYDKDNNKAYMQVKFVLTDWNNYD